MTRPPDPTRAGPPLGLTAEQLDQAAEVIPLDIAAASALWARAAPPRYADLLEARDAPQS